MITVNGFWLGILACLIGEIVLMVLLGILKALFGKEEEKPEIRELDLPEELQKAIAEEIIKHERSDKHDGV